MNTLLTVKQFSEKHRAFSEGSLRYHIFNETTNGFSKAIIRVGRKILIDEEMFFAWLNDQQNQVIEK